VIDDVQAVDQGFGSTFVTRRHFSRADNRVLGLPSQGITEHPQSPRWPG